MGAALDRAREVTSFEVLLTILHEAGNRAERFPAVSGKGRPSTGAVLHSRGSFARGPAQFCLSLAVNIALAAVSIVALIVPVHSAAADAWPWPVDSRDVARQFEPPPEPWAAGHRGVDIRAEQGAVVTAVANGQVHFAGTIVDRGVVSVAHADGATITSYEPVTPLVSKGDDVIAGQPIAVVHGIHAGCGSCLHFGVRVGGEYRDPMLWLRLERPVLLPLADQRVRHADARFDRTQRVVRTRRACTSGSSRGSRAPRAPALP